MGIIDRFTSNSQEKGNIEKFVKLLSQNNETVAFFEPVSSGFLTYEFSRTDFISKVLAGAVMPRSLEAYEQFIDFDGSPVFPHKEVANDQDAQILADVVREKFGADHGVSVIANLDGTAEQTLYVGLNISGQQKGVFKQKMNFHKNEVEERASKIALKAFAREYMR